LPTSLIYIVLSTRGYSPWRPDAVMSTTRCELRSLPPDFQGPSRAHRTARKHAAFPGRPPSLRAIRFQGRPPVKKKRELFPGPAPTSRGSFVLPRCRHILVREY